MNTTGIRLSIILTTFVILTLAACSGPVTVELTREATATQTQTPPQPTSTRTPAVTLTPIPPIDLTQQTWYSTAAAIQKTERAVSQQNWDLKETQITEFSIDCERINLLYSQISPDGNWAAVSCGNKINQTLIVQKRDGTKWVLDFQAYLSPETHKDIMGNLGAKFWSPDSEYLFFTLGLGYDGGGDYCFPIPGDYGDYGLFRLEAKTGEWVTLIPSTDNFPGYEIEFSPTGRRYAASLDGITVSDLRTGETKSITTNGVVERLIWSPDGKSLAYSVASCDEGNVKSSETYTWNAVTNTTKLLMKADDQVLRPEFWVNHQTLRIIGEEHHGLDTFFTIYQYDIEQGNLLFTATATPYP